MASYDYEYYICPNCKKRLTVKLCPDCKVKTKGQGKVSIRFRLIEDFKKKNKRTGWYATKKEAEKEYLQVMATAPKVDLRTRDGISYIFEDMLNLHLTQNAISTAPSTQYTKRKEFAKYITPYFKGMDVREITKDKIINWQNMIYSKNIGGKTISHKYASKLRGFLNTFLDWLFYVYDVPNVMRSVKKPANNQPPPKKEILEMKEFAALDKASINDILWNTIFCFLMHTGCRVGEVQALSESDYRNGEIIINKTISKDSKGRPHLRDMPKNKKAYSKPLDNFIISKLDKYLKWKREQQIPAKFLFGGANFIDIHQYSRKLQFYLKKANITKHITLHSFRHSYVSMLINMDCSTKTVAEMIGDTEEVVMQTYSHLYSSKKQQIVDKLNSFLGTDTGTKF